MLKKHGINRCQVLLLDSYIWRGIKLTRIASSLRKAMTSPCIKIPVKDDSAIESAFP